MTSRVLVGVAAVPETPLPLICTPGDPLLAKNPDGYVSVIVLPAASAPPAVVVNENVAAASLLPATRSDNDIANDALVTWPPIAPELMPADALGSALVATVTPLELPAVALPTVKPVTVTVTAAPAAMA